MTSATDARFAGSIPAIYDRYLVPLLFQPYADDLASRFRDLKQGRLLEIAAGTGVVTSVLRSALPEAVDMVATDLNEGMLRLAEQRLAGRAVGFRPADAQQLPFEAERFDALVSQFGVMFLPDKRAGYREAFRVLKRGGRYTFNVWDRIEENEATAVTERALAQCFPDNPPQFMTRTPFGYFDPKLIRADLESAGFARIEVEVVAKVSRGTPEETAIGFCEGTPIRGEVEQRDAARLPDVTAAVKAALVARYGQGAFDNRMSALVVTAWRD